MSTKNAAKGPKVAVDSAQQADQMTEEGAPDSALGMRRGACRRNCGAPTRTGRTA